MSNFNAADDDLSAAPDEGEHCPGCGAVHEAGSLGPEFLDAIEQLGPRHPAILAEIAQQLTARGFGGQQLKVTDDQVLSIALEMVNPDPNRRYVDWDENGEQKFYFSAWLAAQLVDALAPFAITANVIGDIGGALSPQHADLVINALNRAEAAVVAASAFPTTVLRPEANVDLSLLEEIGPFETSPKLANAELERRYNELHAQETDRFQSARSLVTEKLNEGASSEEAFAAAVAEGLVEDPDA